MADRPYRCLILSDFNPGNLAGYLENDEAFPAVEPLPMDFGQVIPVLTQPDSPAWRDQPDFALVWTQPEKVVASFQKTLDFQPASTAELLAEVDGFTAAILQAATRLKAVWVPSWVIDTDRRGLGMSDFRPGGAAFALQQMNLRLAENLAPAPNIFVLNAQRWISRAGTQAFAPRLWYQAKTPFGNPVFQEAVADVKAAICGLQGLAKKLVIVDLDDTLWGGTVGDAGWENLRLGGHDATAEAFADFQHSLKALTHRGILLGIVSKNEEAVALTALRRHPEMQLRPADFAGWRINWRDKAANVAELADELNLGLQSVVFIDENPAERARVREALPEVLVPDWPETPQLFVQALARLRCFDAPHLTREDAQRTAAYAAEQQRTALKREVGSLEDWLCGLNISVEVAPLDAANLERAAQLLNKTNQMNLSTRRLTTLEFRQWAEASHHHVWVFRVADKYGDSGLTGLASLDTQNPEARIIDFVLSCRVFGRRVEETMLHWLMREAGHLGAQSLRAEYLPTDKNKPCLDFWQRSGFDNPAPQIFTRATAADYPLPAAIQFKTVATP